MGHSFCSFSLAFGIVFKETSNLCIDQIETSFDAPGDGNLTSVVDIGIGNLTLYGTGNKK